MSDDLLNESPPLSPVLSDVVSLPDTGSDLAYLSDVSGLSDTDDQASSRHSVSDHDDVGEEFEEITRSMIASSVHHKTDDAEEDAKEDDSGFIGNQSPPTTTRTTPSASMSLVESECSANTPMKFSMVTSRDLIYPNPLDNDGRSPFGLHSLKSNPTEDSQLDDFSILDINGNSERNKERQICELAESLFEDKESQVIEKSTIESLEETSSPNVIGSTDISTSSPFLARPGTPAPEFMAEGDIEPKDTTARNRAFLTPRNGYRWPTVLTFSVVGVVLAMAGVTYNASSATYSAVIAAQDYNASRALMNVVPVAAPSSQSPDEISKTPATSSQAATAAFVTSLEPPMRRTEESSSMSGSISDEHSKSSFDPLPPAISAISLVANKGLSTLSSVSSALSLPIYRTKSESHAGGTKGRKRSRKSKPEASSSRSLAVIPEFAQKGLAIFPSFANRTYQQLGVTERALKQSGKKARRNAKALMTRLDQQASLSKSESHGNKQDVVSKVADSKENSHNLSGVCFRAKKKSKQERNIDRRGFHAELEVDNGTTQAAEDKIRERDEVLEDDLFLLPLDTTASIRILPTMDLEAILAWLKKSFDIYTAQISSCLTLGAAANEAAILQAIHNLDLWSIQAKRYLNNKLSVARSELKVYQKGMQKRYRRAQSIKKGSVRKARKNARKLVKAMYGV